MVGYKCGFLDRHTRVPKPTKRNCKGGQLQHDPCQWSMTLKTLQYDILTQKSAEVLCTRREEHLGSNWLQRTAILSFKLHGVKHSLTEKIFSTQLKEVGLQKHLSSIFEVTVWLQSVLSEQTRHSGEYSSHEVSTHFYTLYCNTYFHYSTWKLSQQ